MCRMTSFSCWSMVLCAACALAQDPRPLNPAGQSKSPDAPRVPGATAGKPSSDRKRPSDTLKEGDMAPNFELKSIDGKKSVQLEAMRGKPVALVFGSYT